MTDRPSDPALDMAQQQCGINQSVIVIRRAILSICSAEVNLGRLVLFSDYGIEGAERETLVAIDNDLAAIRERLAEFEAARLEKVNGPVKDTYGATRE